jgi:two-component system response regulator DevR
MDTTGASVVRVAIVDDHPAILASVAAAIHASPDLRLVGTGRTLDEARAFAATPRDAAGRADVLVCDMQLAGEAEGLRLLDHAAGDAPALLILSSFDQAPLVRAAFERGAAGYMVKTAEIGEILEAIRTVGAGGTAF